jgi:serine/threonine protein kinase
MQWLDDQAIKANIPFVDNLVQIFRGGQKTVLRANHTVYGDVALKLILNPSPTVTQRIQREIGIGKDHKFSNVPQLFTSGHFEFNGETNLYLIERFIQGQTLRTLLKANGSLSLTSSLSLMQDLLTSAVELEQIKIVHRDIKPENIMIGRDGKTWVLDFGIARILDDVSLTASNDRFGPHTAGYAAPEQFRNVKAEIDNRADLFSIGVVSYEVISGMQPFRNGARDDLEILKRVESRVPPPLTIRGDTRGQLNAYIGSLMNARLSRRPANAVEALDWFNGLLPTIVLS